MNWPTPPVPKTGDIRVRTFFAWFPCEGTDRRTYWLQRMTVREHLFVHAFTYDETWLTLLCLPAALYLAFCEVEADAKAELAPAHPPEVSV